jgi:hypothetical protein
MIALDEPTEKDNFRRVKLIPVNSVAELQHLVGEVGDPGEQVRKRPLEDSVIKVIATRLLPLRQGPVEVLQEDEQGRQRERAKCCRESVGLNAQVLKH